MIKIFLFCFIFLSHGSFAHDHRPQDGNFTTVNGLFRLLKRTKGRKYTFLAELSSGRMYDNQTATDFKIGAYRKIAKGKKVGLFLFNRQGLRHADDWILHDGHWEWEDSTNRSEQEIRIDYTHRFQRSPLIPFITSLKTELTYNFFNTNSIFIATPDFSYFFLKRRRPKVSLHTKLPLYFTLNFDGETLYKYGLYQSVLYHFSKKYILGLTMRHFVEKWRRSEVFTDLFPNEEYVATDTSNIIQLDFIIRI